MITNGIDPKESGLRLYQMLRARDISVLRVADELHIDHSNVYRWLNGRTLPSAEHLYYLAKLLQTDMEVLLVERRWKDG